MLNLLRDKMSKEKQKKPSRTIKHLIQSSNKGNFFSAFQLFLNYSEGKDVEAKDELLAQKYFNEVESALSQKNMKLSSLNLTDFRRFRNLEISFDERITVIIGDNGAGKTSIVESVAKLFSWFNNGVERKDINGRPIVEADINVDSKDFCEVTGIFRFDVLNEFEISLGRIVSGYSGSSPTNVTLIKQAASMYRVSANNHSIKIPLLTYYSVERSDFKLTNTVTEKAHGDGISSRFSDLKTALYGNGKLEDFSKLYMELVNLAEGEDSAELHALKSRISAIQNTIDVVYERDSIPENDVINAKLNELKQDLANLIGSNPSEKYQRHLNFVNQAIEKLVPDVSNLHIDRSTGKPRLMVNNFGTVVNINQLSQGQKMLVALVGDLSRRLVRLNPDADEPLSSHGIVIIDEIELHLHPKWQQEILINLQSTFTNLQFIVTTHSPQILSTVDNKCIRQICLDDHGFPVIKTPTFQTKGVTSAAILDRIMGTNSTPEKVEQAKWINDFYRLLKTDNKELLDSTFTKIKAHFGIEHPVVLDCESAIRIAEMKARLSKVE